jgi:hypothetical protein
MLIIGIILIAWKKRRMGLLVITLVGGSASLFALQPVPVEAAGINTGFCGNVVGGYITSKSQIYSAMNQKAIVFSDQPTYTMGSTGGTMKVTITNNTDCQMKLSLGSYRMFDMVVQNQSFYDATDLINVPRAKGAGVPSVTTITVQIPTCSAQMDMFLGKPAPRSMLPNPNNDDPAFAAWIRDSLGQTYWPNGTGHPAQFELTYTRSASGIETMHNTLLASRPFCVRPPLTPSNLTATASCGGSIALGWKVPTASKTAGAAMGYYIYRDNIRIVAIHDGNSTSFVDQYPGIGVSHTYRIEAFNSGGVSPRSTPTPTVVSQPCPPNAPTNVAAAPGSCDTGLITVSWKAASNATSYSVFDGTTRIASGLTSLTYTHTNLTKKSSHSYTVEAVNNGGSTRSAPAVVATAPDACSVVVAPTVDLSANPLSVDTNGKTTLTWKTTNNPTSCIASSGWSGSKSPTGGSQISGALTEDTTFTITCSNSAGTASDSVRVTLTTSTNPGLVTCQPEDPSKPGVRISQAPVGKPVKWVAVGGSGTYVWSGSVSASGQNLTSVTRVYTTVGSKQVFVSLNGGTLAQCDANNFSVSAQPGYKEF